LFDLIQLDVRGWCNAELVLVGMGQSLFYRAGAECTSQNKVTAEKNYMLGLYQCPIAHALIK